MARKMKNEKCGNKYSLTWNMARNSQKHGKWKMYTVGPGVCREIWTSWKMRKRHCRIWNREKREINIVGLGIWWETWKSLKIRNTHCSTENMARNAKKREKWEMHNVGSEIWQEIWKNFKNEKCTYLEYGKKNEKWKMRK